MVSPLARRAQVARTRERAWARGLNGILLSTPSYESHLSAKDAPAT
jgi:hypothetical protein